MTDGLELVIQSEPLQASEDQVMRTPRILLAVALAALLLGCTKQIPKEKVEYVGEWHGKEMALLITQEGSVAYRRLEGASPSPLTLP